MKKPIFIECVISGLGAILYATGCSLLSTNSAIPYLFAILSTMMVHNPNVIVIIREFKKSHTWKGNRTIRKNFIFLISMLVIYWLIIFIFMHLKLS